MGKRASSALCLALTVALVLAAVALGAYRGWSGERRQALETFTENTALRDYLEERSMDAANLRVVAARHLDREDEDLAALTRVRKTLTDPEATVEELEAVVPKNVAQAVYDHFHTEGGSEGDGQECSAPDDPWEEAGHDRPADQ